MDRFAVLLVTFFRHYLEDDASEKAKTVLDLSSKIWRQLRNSQLILVLHALGCSADVFLDLEKENRKLIADLLINTRTAHSAAPPRLNMVS